MNTLSMVKFRVDFDRSAIYWETDQQYNKLFLVQQQQYMNLCLKRRGILFVNEVLDALGVDRVREGVTAGWVSDEDSFMAFENMGFNEKTGAIVFDLNAREDIRPYLKAK